MSDELPPTYRHVPSFSIEFHFSDFTSDGTLDREAFAEAVFDVLCAGEGALAPLEYSSDGWDLVRDDS